MNLKRIIRQIAREHGDTPNKVRTDMEEAMKASMCSHEPEAMAHWENISKTVKEPRLEDFITYIVKVSTSS